MKYDIFISYRREGGYDTAKHLNDLLVRDGYKVSFDIDTLRSGDFDTQLLERIDQCKDFILIVDQHAFDRTIDPNFNPKNDWMRCELAYALKKNKNIIPVFLSGVTHFPANLPEDVAGVIKKNGPEYNRYYFNDFYKILKSKFLHKKVGNKYLIYILMLLVVIVVALPMYNMFHQSCAISNTEGETTDKELSIEKDQTSIGINKKTSQKVVTHEIELFTVINTYVQAFEQDEYHSIPWSVFAQKPLTPLTHSYEEAPEDSGSPNVLRFKGKLQYNGEPLATLSSGEAADWTISLLGPNACPMTMRIEPDEDAEITDDKLVLNVKSVALKTGFTIIRKKENNPNGYTYLYQKGELLLFVYLKKGNTGTILEMTISQDMEDINRYNPYFNKSSRN